MSDEDEWHDPLEEVDDQEEEDDPQDELRSSSSSSLESLSHLFQDSDSEEDQDDDEEEEDDDIMEDAEEEEEEEEEMEMAEEEEEPDEDAGWDDEDDETPPEGAALPTPSDVESYFERKMNARRLKLIHTTVLQHIRKISNYCTWLLQKLLCQDPNQKRLPTRSEVQKLRRCYDQWLELWVTRGTWINELRFIRLAPTPDTPEHLLDQHGLRKVRSALGESVFPELCRMWFLIHYGELKQQKEHLKRHQINVDELDVKDIPSVHWALRHTLAEFWVTDWPQLWPLADNRAFAKAKAKDRNAVRPRRASPLWDRPIMTYTQYEIYQAVMLLTERIEDYPCSNEVIRMIMLLYLRMSTLFCQAAPAAIFDKEDMRRQVPGYDLYIPNRKFIMWANIYFYELHRRVFWYRLMMQKPMRRMESMQETLGMLDALLVRRVRAWVHDSLERIGEEEFEDLYARASEENYAFPGDDQYIRYGHPEGAVSRGDTLMELRPQRQGYRFFSEDAVSHHVILANAKSGETHLDRLMIIMAIDNYFLTKVSESHGTSIR